MGLDHRPNGDNDMAGISFESFLSIAEIWLRAAWSVRSIVLIAAAGLVLFTIGWMMGRLKNASIPASSSVPVQLKVIALHEERIGGRNGRVSFRPEFEVLNGPFKGTQAKSGAASFPAICAVGDIEDGWFNPSTGDLETQSVLRTVSKVQRLLYAGGAVFLMAAFVWAATL